MFEQAQCIIDTAIHFDAFLPLFIEEYGLFAYFFVFLIVFLETGLVIAPYLPGDSLLFLVGAISEHGDLNVLLATTLLALAAIAGDTMNYWIGRSFGVRSISRGIPFVRRQYLERTEAYFKEYGGKTIVIARFIPFIRTLAPFLAGAGKMDYSRFVVYNVSGGTLWVSGFVLAGYFFGNLPVISEHFNIVILAIVVVSLIGVGSTILELKKV